MNIKAQNDVLFVEKPGRESSELRKRQKGDGNGRLA